MNRLSGLILVLLLVITITSGQAFAKADTLTNIKPPLLFIQNNGQFDEDVAFYAKPMGLEVFITKNGEIVYSLTKKEADTFKQTAFKETLVSKPTLSGKDKHQAVFNYFIGNDRSKWRSNVPTYKTIELGEISRGINLKLKVKETNIEKLFYVSPGADVNDILIKTQGGERGLNDKGELIVKTPLGEITFTKPVAFQEIDGKRVDVKVSYRLQNDGYGFDVGNYDKTKPLIIDPLLASRFVGGAGTDAANAIAKDSSNNIYIAGYTVQSSSFPKIPVSPDPNPVYECSTCDGYDMTVSKFDSDLNMLASTFIGGNSNDICNDILIDGSGNVYLIGSTMSTNFPVGGSYIQGSNGGGWDAAFVALNNDLTNLLAGTYLGGNGYDSAYKGVFRTDQPGYIYIVGETTSDNFPVTSGVYQGSPGGGTDAFIVLVNTGFTTLSASTYLGKTGVDVAKGIVSMGGDGVIVVGFTNSTDFTTGASNAHGLHAGGYDGYAAYLNAGLTSLFAARLFGGSGEDYAMSVVFDTTYLFITGTTTSPSSGTGAFGYDQFYGTPGSDDENAFIIKMSSDLATVNVTAGIGGKAHDSARAIYINGSDVYIAGTTSSTSGLGPTGGFPVSANAYSTSNSGFNDAFIAKFSNGLDELQSATFIGGNDNDTINGLLFANSALFACGETGSTNFPTTFGPNFGGMTDQFVLKMTSDLSASSSNYTLTVTKAGSGGGTVLATGCTLDWSGNTGTCTVTENTQITLTGSADANSFFSGFTGAGCIGAAPCVITMDSNKSVTATFQPAGTGGVIHLPQTGQTASYDNNLLERDDGALRTGQYWPTNRFITGSPTGTVIDKLTGLMWMAAGDSPTIGSCTLGAGIWTDALDYVTCLNNNNYLGFSDWRLPNVHEMASLYHAGVSINATWLNSQGFSNVPTSGAWYWTSTTDTAATSKAIAIATDNGSFVSDAKTNQNYAIAVRMSGYSPILSMLPQTGQITSYDPTRPGEDGDIQAGVPIPNPRFVDDTNTEITIDNLTGLKWPKAANTPTHSTCTGGAKTWQGAIDYINCLNANNYLGYNDWRLPNKNELRSLMFYGSANPALQSGHPFTNVQSIYWTSTTLHPNMSNAYTVNFSTGLLSNVAKTSSYHVLPVRGGLISITVSVTGSGVVKDLDNQINCPPTCATTYTYDGTDDINLSFIPNTGKSLTNVIVNDMNLGPVHNVRIRSATHYVDVQVTFTP